MFNFGSSPFKALNEFNVKRVNSSRQVTVTKHYQCTCTYMYIICFVYCTRALGIIMSTDSSALVCVSDFEEYAKRVLPKYAFDYYISGAEEEQTLRDNKKAYARLAVSD